MDIKLRDGVKFHNGEALDAESVKVTLDRIVTDKTRMVNYWSDLKEVVVIDPRTVVIKLSNPNNAMLNSLSVTPIIPAKAFKEKGKKMFEHPIGSGPFEFVEWLPKQRVVMKKFDGYWWQKGKC